VWSCRRSPFTFLGDSKSLLPCRFSALSGDAVAFVLGHLVRIGSLPSVPGPHSAHLTHGVESPAKVSLHPTRTRASRTSTSRNAQGLLQFTCRLFEVDCDAAVLLGRGCSGANSAQYFMSMQRRSPFRAEGTAQTIPTTEGVVTPAAARFPSESLQRRPFSLTFRGSLRV